MVWPATLTEPWVVESLGMVGSASALPASFAGVSFAGASLLASCAKPEPRPRAKRSNRKQLTKVRKGREVCKGDRFLCNEVVAAIATNKLRSTCRTSVVGAYKLGYQRWGNSLSYPVSIWSERQE